MTIAAANNVPGLNDDRPLWDGPELNLNYSRAEDLRILHRIPVDMDLFITVLGHPDDADYEWVLERGPGQVLAHSDCAYGIPEIALRDGLCHQLGPAPESAPGYVIFPKS